MFVLPFILSILLILSNFLSVLLVTLRLVRVPDSFTFRTPLSSNLASGFSDVPAAFLRRS